MKEFYVSVTEPNTCKYPLHSHKNWEVMYYLKGQGYLKTESKNIPFKENTIIVVPPNVIHGSVSDDGFVNISIGGDFENLFLFDAIVSFCDNTELEGKQLAALIQKNRHKNNNYISSLCTAYAHFILQNNKYEKNINRAVNEIVEAISNNFYDCEIDITFLLKQSGYAEDYIRNEFKKQTGYTPVDFLTKIRIGHAKKLIEIYGNTLSVAKVAEACGFNDHIYFSRRFRQLCGISPNDYKKKL